MKAFLSIILLLAFGLGVWGNTPTSEKIAEWKEDAKNGDAWAQFTLGIAYAIGRGVPQDDKAAINWYKKAAEQGHADSQAGLGLINWEYGNGIVEDKVQAYAWLNIAAANDDKWKETKSELAQKMTIEQIAKARKLSTQMIESNLKLMGD